jgi:hypothetical protein
MWAWQGRLVTGRAEEISGRPRLLILRAYQHSECPVPSRFLRRTESEMPPPSGFDHASTTKSNSTRSIAVHPCKKCKDGAPSVGTLHAKERPPGATRSTGLPCGTNVGARDPSLSSPGSGRWWNPPSWHCAAGSVESPGTSIRGATVSSVLRRI